ncbi:YiiX/YebB-like N1pC/P60 family cysteine hydrolase [Labilibaculum sp.]|uniref:YiiX/YebB-like N1pC/P60 family cysteine hydrolase n=1 Tax=Labilibaculum sp. TaxID=2060723 RepID=UPI002AA804E5|nr:YiiX/YebB-like N1pC/P60 family cysteine hydrolase [Labilibaculum sp.]
MYFLRILVALVLGAQFTACHNLQKKPRFALEKGDLLFQDLDSDSISDAIESVTGGEEHLSFSHVGIVDVNSNGDTLVLEAISKGVTYTKLNIFLKRSTTADQKPKVEVGRLKPEFSALINKALDAGKQLIGKPYDDIYIMGDSTYYCSELIYEIFSDTQDSIEVFQLNPMTFKDSKTGNFLPFWVEYYKKLGVDIPEGKPGLNPNGMHGSPNIEIVFSYLRQ